MAELMLVDGTLREGEQSPGVFFTRSEKLAIAAELDRAGVPLLDVGMPSVSAEERDTIAALTSCGLKAAIGVSVRLRQEEIDQALACGAQEVFVICPASPVHRRTKLAMRRGELLAACEDTVAHAAGRGLGVNLVVEDGVRAEEDFLAAIAEGAARRGARRVFLCDTAGVMEPLGMHALVQGLRRRLPERMALGVHCHNDLGLATANTIAAIQAGATCPAVTVNGIGERAGNAPLHEVVLVCERLLSRAAGVALPGLPALSRLVEEASGMPLAPHTPIVGYNAFRHESGIHVDGILKDTRTYTAVDPRRLERDNVIALGKHTGVRAVRHLLEQRGFTASEGQAAEIVRRVKAARVAADKGESARMIERIRRYYEASLDLPAQAFWRIVEAVLKEDG